MVRALNKMEWMKGNQGKGTPGGGWGSTKPWTQTESARWRNRRLVWGELEVTETLGGKDPEPESGATPLLWMEPNGHRRVNVKGKGLNQTVPTPLFTYILRKRCFSDAPWGHAVPRTPATFGSCWTLKASVKFFKQAFLAFSPE